MDAAIRARAAGMSEPERERKQREQMRAAFEREREPWSAADIAPYRAAMDDALRQLAREVGVPAALLDYGSILARAVELNDRYAGRWHVWFVALAGSVEWLARPFDAEPVGEPQVSAWSVGELIEQIEQIERSGGKRLWVRVIMSARADPAA